jgi:hypothetical protein
MKMMTGSVPDSDEEDEQSDGSRQYFCQLNEDDNVQMVTEARKVSFDEDDDR